MINFVIDIVAILKNHYIFLCYSPPLNNISKNKLHKFKHIEK